MLIKHLAAAVLCLGLATAAGAQTTVVTATIQDPVGQAYSNGTYSIQFHPNSGFLPSQYKWQGGSFTQQFSGVMDGSGTFTVSIPDNAFITPSGSQWDFQVCPQASVSQCNTVTLTVSGVSQNVGGTINAALPPISVAVNPAPDARPFALAYSDAEISNPVIGAKYVNLSDGLLHMFTTLGWITTGFGFVTSATSVPAIAVYSGIGNTLIPDTNIGDSTGSGDFYARSSISVGSGSTPFTWTFKTVDFSTVGNPAAGFMTWGGDSVTGKWKCKGPGGVDCGPSGTSGLATQSNGTPLASQTVLNFVNPSNFNGLAFTYSNPTGGNVTWGVSGTLNNGGITNPFTTVNGQTCTLGSPCTIAGSAPTLVAGASDTLAQTTANGIGTFATQASLTAGTLGFFEIRARGTYTTSNTASPLLNFQVNGGGTSPICSHGTNNFIGLSQTSTWDLVCFVHILTTGAPGTAVTWGNDEANATAGGSASVNKLYNNTAALAFTTTTAQTFSISQTGTMVLGESATLTSLVIRGY
jgi:hypothetical protein